MIFTGVARSCEKFGVYLHASSVNIEGKAVLFLGHSTSGKSTISEILSERYPLIADDKIWVEIGNEGIWMAQGISETNKFGKGYSYSKKLEQHPLWGIIRIFKANETKIEQITQRVCCKYLMDAVFEIDFQRRVTELDRKKNWFRLVADISRKTIGWHLTFQKDRSIIDVIERVVD